MTGKKNKTDNGIFSTKKPSSSIIIIDQTLVRDFSPCSKCFLSH